MKHIKNFEKYKPEIEEPIKLKLGKYVLLKTSKSIPHPSGLIRMKFFSKVKDINIFIDNKIVGNMQIDERGFNILHHYDDSMFLNWDDKQSFRKLPKFIREFKFLIVQYLLDCYADMKKSNPEYGTYYNGKGNEGRENLMTHDFIDFVKNDFKTSKSILVQKIKKINKDFIIYKNADKYNI